MKSTRQWRSVLPFVALLFGAATILYLAWLFGLEKAPEDSPAEESSGEQRPTPRPTRVTLVPKPKVEEPEPQPGEDNKSSQAVEAWEVTFSFLDEDQRPVSVDFNVEVSKEGESPKVRSALPLTQMASDNAGTAMLRAPSTFERMVIKCADEDWFFDTYTHDRINGQASSSVSVICLARVNVYFDVFLDTGDPCLGGTIQIVKGGGFRSAEYPCKGDRIKVDGIPVTDLLVRVRPTAPGYGFVNLAVPKDQLSPNAVIPLRLSKSKYAKGDAAVLLGEGRISARGLRIFDAKSGVLLQELGDVQVRNGRYEFKNLYAGEYFIYGAMDDQVYYESFEVKDSEVSEVTLRLVMAASVSARILTPNGEPLAGCILRVRFAGYADFPAAPGAHQQGMVAASTWQGNVELRGLHPSVTELVVEGEGLQHLVIPVNLQPGEELLMADIVMQPAQGKVAVSITGTKTAEKYEAALLDPNGGHGYSTLKPFPAGAELGFENLSLRDYYLIVRPLGGGKVVGQRISLSPAQAELELTVDVSELERGQDG
jgi:hypothetical protein